MNTSKSSKISKLFETMPKVVKRRPYDRESFGDTYLESDRDFAENNRDACIWFLENVATLKKLAQNLSKELD